MTTLSARHRTDQDTLQYRRAWIVIWLADYQTEFSGNAVHTIRSYDGVRLRLKLKQSLWESYTYSRRALNQLRAYQKRAEGNFQAISGKRIPHCACRTALYFRRNVRDPLCSCHRACRRSGGRKSSYNYGGGSFYESFRRSARRPAGSYANGHGGAASDDSESEGFDYNNFY